MSSSKISIDQMEIARFLLCLPAGTTVTSVVTDEDCFPNLMLSIEGDAVPEAGVVYRHYENVIGEPDADGNQIVTRKMTFTVTPDA